LENNTGWQLLDVRRIWNEAPHNAFTDLLRYRDQWWCVFREAEHHLTQDGTLRVLRSPDGKHWESAALLSWDIADLRDGKLSVCPDGRLMINGGAALHDRSTHSHISVVFFSDTGEDWSPPQAVGEPNFWIWKMAWAADAVYGIAYRCGGDPRTLRLYRSENGVDFTQLAANLPDEANPTEAALHFDANQTAWCLLRRNHGTGLLGRANAPYTDWQWQNTGTPLGGPAILRLPDGQLIGACRLVNETVRTSLVELDSTNGTLKEALTLPSGGDTSYPGLVWHDGQLWISYYSSHEGQSAIYLARAIVGRIS